jgi:Ala-tRNA(Pro) deacylase
MPHKVAFTAQEEAAATHVPGRDWAKVVVCIADGKAIQAVLPATMNVNFRWLRELTGTAEVRLATEREMEQLFPDCEAGAIPPIALYGYPVYVDLALAFEPEIVFNAGTHNEAIGMRWGDFAKSVRPIVGNFGERQLDQVGAFRLSFRE